MGCLTDRRTTGSRKLIAYERIPDSEVDGDAVRAWLERTVQKGEGTTANDLNPFRRLYFKKFES